MATQPKPKPKPEPEPKPDEPDDYAAGPPQPPDPTGGPMGRLDAASSPVIEEPPQTDTNASGNSLTERVEKLEERVAAPPVGIGRRP
jgi:hypothetical protein